MNKIIILSLFILIFYMSETMIVFTQNIGIMKTYELSKEDLSIKKVEIKEQGQIGNSFKEAAYFAPIRYVIVYNEIYAPLDLNERRIKILMDEKSFTVENLVAVFKQITKSFPSPNLLRIEAHTSLMTIETPEEHLMYEDSQDSRFREKKKLHKTAYFTHGKQGKEVLTTFIPEKVRYKKPPKTKCS